MKVRITEYKRDRYRDIRWRVEYKGGLFWHNEGHYDSLEFARVIADRLTKPEEEAKHTYEKVVWEYPPTTVDYPGP